MSGSPQGLRYKSILLAAGCFLIAASSGYHDAVQAQTAERPLLSVKAADDFGHRQAEPVAGSQPTELGSVDSPPLSELARETLKPSQNLYADLLLAHTGERARLPATRTPDEQLQITTPPQLRALPLLDFNPGDQAVTLVTHVDAVGHVTDYEVLSGQRSPELMNRLDRMMYFSVFRPATLSGKPTDGKVVLSLRRITVRG